MKIKLFLFLFLFYFYDMECCNVQLKRDNKQQSHIASTGMYNQCPSYVLAVAEQMVNQEPPILAFWVPNTHSLQVYSINYILSKLEG